MSAPADSTLGMAPPILIGAYLVMLAGIGVYGYLKRRHSEEDYFLAGRRLGFVVTVLTIAATFFSSGAMLGVPGAVYKDGVAFFLFALNLPVAGGAIYLFGSRIGRIGRAKGYVTPGDMLSEYYDHSPSVRILVALLGFLYIVPYVVIQLRAGGHLAAQMFAATPVVRVAGVEMGIFTLGATTLTLVMMLYILVGGMRSVALADVVQGAMLLTGMLVSGAVAIFAFGGPARYFRAVSQLPPDALSLPGTTGRYTPWLFLTLCVFASLASLVHPAQWMRMYAARSARALKRSALTFSLILPLCYLLGVMVVGLGARALYPPEVRTDPATGAVTVTAHPDIGDHDQALLALLRKDGVRVLGGAGSFVVTLIMMSIVAASMSTADANLHALSAVLTRDVYDRFLRPRARERERAWAGRAVIVAGALLSLWMVLAGQRRPDFAPLRTIIEMQFVAMAFACQMLPVTIDVLFIRKGSRIGAISGMTAGLAAVLLFTPLPGILLGRESAETVAGGVNYMKRLFDIGFCGLLVNVPVFVLVSMVTRKPDPGRVAEFARLMTEDPPGGVSRTSP